MEDLERLVVVSIQLQNYYYIETFVYNADAEINSARRVRIDYVYFLSQIEKKAFNHIET